MSDLRLGRRLQWATLAWNAVEVFVTISLGLAAGSLALVAFGLDSLIEISAGLVVLWHMHPGEADQRAARDRRARRLVGLAFAALAIYLLIASVRSLTSGDEPDASPLGVAYLAVTAVVMFILARVKRDVGLRLESEPFIAEAQMTLLDGCLAAAILTALVLNAVWGWWWTDPLAAIAIGLVAAHEAWEGLR